MILTKKEVLQQEINSINVTYVGDKKYTIEIAVGALSIWTYIDTTHI